LRTRFIRAIQDSDYRPHVIWLSCSTSTMASRIAGRDGGQSFFDLHHCPDNIEIHLREHSARLRNSIEQLTSLSERRMWQVCSEGPPEKVALEILALIKNCSS